MLGNVSRFFLPLHFGWIYAVVVVVVIIFVVVITFFVVSVVVLKVVVVVVLVMGAVQTNFRTDGSPVPDANIKR